MPATFATSIAPTAASPLTLISRTVLAAVTAQVDITVPTGYRHLTLYWAGSNNHATNSYAVYLRINNNAGASAYAGQSVVLAGSTLTPAVYSGAAFMRVGPVGSGVALPTIHGTGVVEFPTWGSTLGTTNVISRGSYYQDSTNCYTEYGGFTYLAAGPYTQINLLLSSASWTAGSTFTLYGMT